MLNVFAMLRYERRGEFLQALADLGCDLLSYQFLDWFFGQVGGVDLYFKLENHRQRSAP